jgi:hypothetical protein
VIVEPPAAGLAGQDDPQRNDRHGDERRDLTLSFLEEDAGVQRTIRTGVAAFMISVLDLLAGAASSQ